MQSCLCQHNLRLYREVGTGVALVAIVESAGVAQEVICDNRDVRRPVELSYCCTTRSVAVTPFADPVEGEDSTVNRAESVFRSMREQTQERISAAVPKWTAASPAPSRTPWRTSFA